MLALMYPSMPRKHRLEALEMMDNLEGKRVPFERFDGLVIRWRRYVRENDPDGTWELDTLDHVKRFVMRRAPTQALPVIHGDTTSGLDVHKV